MARALAPDGLAVYSLAITTVLCLSSVHRALIAQPLNILGAQESEALRRLRYSNLMRIQCWMLPSMALLALAAGWAFFPAPALVLGTAVYTAVYALQDLVRRYHYTDGQIVKAVPGDVFGFGGQCLLLAGMLLMQQPVSEQSVLWWMSVPLLIAAVWTHRRILQSGLGSAGTGPRPFEHLREHWSNSKWVVLSQLVWIGASQLIPFQLAAYAQPNDVAAYHAANALMNALNVFRLTLGNYLPGQAARVLSAGGEASLRAYLGRVGGGCLSIAVIAFVFFHWAGDVLIDALFAGKYQDAKAVIPAMAVIHLLAMSSLISAAGAQVMGSTRVIFVSNAMALVLTLTLGSWFIHLWGLWGSIVALAIGLLLPAAIQAVQLFLLFQRRLRQA